MTEEFFTKLKEKYPGRRQEFLIEMLLDIQDKYKCLTKSSVRKVSDYLEIPESKVYGIATFYNNLRFKKPGRYHIQICRGTACHLDHSSRLLDAATLELNIQPGQTTKDGLFSLEAVPCIGACVQSPAIVVNGEVKAHLSIVELRKLIKKYKVESKQNASAE